MATNPPQPAAEFQVAANEIESAAKALDQGHCAGVGRCTRQMPC